MIPLEKLPAWCAVTGNPAWPYIVCRQVTASLPGCANECNYEITGTNGRPLGQLGAWGQLAIFPGYAFDGATCAPDVVSLMRAVVVHDILCQCCTNRNFPFERAEVDEWFLDIAIEDKAATMGFLYHAGIAMFGGLHRLLFRPRRSDQVSLTITK